jgi:hypothetical protein
MLKDTAYIYKQITDPKTYILSNSTLNNSYILQAEAHFSKVIDTKG